MTGKDHDALKCILSPAEATRKLARRRLRLSEVEFEVVHCSKFKHQVSVAVLLLQTTGEDCNPVEGVVPVMTGGSLLEDGRQGRIKPSELIDDCDNSGITPTFTRVSAGCQVSTPGAEITTPTLTELVTERAKDTSDR